jgi:hypothetical protein
MRLAAFLLLIAPATAAGQVDFTTHDGFERTCARYGGARAFTSDAERIAFAVCGGVELLRAGARAMQDHAVARMEGPQAVARLRAILEDALARIRSARLALEAVKGAGPYLRMAPGTWALDLDGDGVASPAEQQFFRVPKRGDPSQSIAPVIRVDRSDVYWAIAYCHFAEAALNLVLAYDAQTAPGQFRLELRDAERVRAVAYRNLQQGLQYSRRLRESLLQETDDDAEWIPSPKQLNTSFPLVMDAGTFGTWGELLRHLDLLAAGKTLLGGAIGNRADQRLMVRDLTAGLCGPGEGINLRGLFLQPIREPLELAQWRTRCVKASAEVPYGGLAKLINDALARNAARGPQDMTGEWVILRHLYWVN